MKKFIALLAFLLLFSVPLYSAIESYDQNQSGYYNLFTLLIGNDLPELFTSAAEVTAARDGAASLLAKEDAQDALISALASGSGVLVSSGDTSVGYLDGKLLAGEGIDLTKGTPGGNETLTISGEDATGSNKGIAKLYDEDDMVSDATDGAPTEQSVKAYVTAQVGAKLSNVVEDTTPQAGGEFDFQAHSAGFTLQTATGDGTTTIDWKLGNLFKFTFGAMGETFTFTASTKPGRFTLIMKQDSVGSRAATWPSGIYWRAGVAPILSTAANAIDIVSLIYDGTSWYGGYGDYQIP